MATFGNYNVIRRYNRPNVTSKTLLELFFANNGTYFDPNDVSCVYVLPDTGSTLGSPEIYINRQASDVGTPAYGLLNATGLSSVAAYLDVSNTTYGTSADAPSAYSPEGVAASAIYRTAEGHFDVVTDVNAFPELSGTGNYFDIWMVKDFSGSEYRLYWNKFSLYDDRIVSFTEPFQITTRNKLIQKYITLGSKIDLRIDTEHFVANKDMSEDLKTIWRNCVIDNAYIQIRKRNPQTTGEMTTVVPWTQTGVNVTSEDTIMYLWDTATVSRGDYTVQVSYDLLQQTFYSEEFSVILR